MGSCLCNSLDDNTKFINSRLQEEEQKEKFVIKLLFLGSGGSGKSTIFKQLQWLHGHGFDDADRKLLVQHIHSQIICQMKQAIKHYSASTSTQKQADSANDTTIVSQETTPNAPSTEDTEDDKLQNAINTINDYTTFHVLTQELADCIKFVWKNHNKIQNMFTVHQENPLFEETTQYFWNDIDRICADDYIPNKQDIINVRYRTTGIIEKQFKVKDKLYHIFDPGGQKSERKKWVQVFDDVKAVVFVVNLSCYNQLMFEDLSKNAMVDSLELFHKTVNDDHFRETPIILFLNKKDLFKMKIKEIPITACPFFDDFDVNHKNPNNYMDALKYVEFQFKLQCESQDREIFVHATCAMDDKNIEKVFNDVRRIHIESKLKNL